jgi:hypothetical protein
MKMKTISNKKTGKVYTDNWILIEQSGKISLYLNVYIREIYPDNCRYSYQAMRFSHVNKKETKIKLWISRWKKNKSICKFLVQTLP